MTHGAGWIGVDVGTSSIKMIAVGDGGILLAEHEVTLSVSRSRTDYAEADPLDWVSSIQTTLRSWQETVEFRGLSVTGQMHGAVLLDDHGKPVRPAILWPDTRSAPFKAEWDRLPGEELGRLGNPWSPGMTGPVVSWLYEHERASVNRAARVVLPKDFVRVCLAPGSGDVTDPTDASGTLLWNVGEARWTASAGSLVPARLLPAVVPSGEPIGYWSGTEVYVGAGDTPSTLLALECGLGGWLPGDLVINLGTGAQVISPLAEPPCLSSGWPSVHTYVATTGKHFAMVAVQNAGLALAWARDRIGTSWPTMAVMARHASMGANGAIFSPFVVAERGVLGETRTPAGWSFEDPPLADAARSAVEAQAFLVKYAAEILRADIGRVFLVGGGAREPWIGQLLADVLETPVRHVAARSMSAAGAVLLAKGPLLERLSASPTLFEPRVWPSLPETYQRWLAYCYPSYR